jgi:hypothetical protein
VWLCYCVVPQLSAFVPTTKTGRKSLVVIVLLPGMHPCVSLLFLQAASTHGAGVPAEWYGHFRSGTPHWQHHARHDASHAAWLRASSNAGSTHGRDWHRQQNDKDQGPAFQVCAQGSGARGGCWAAYMKCVGQLVVSLYVYITEQRLDMRSPRMNSIT